MGSVFETHAREDTISLSYLVGIRIRNLSSGTDALLIYGARMQLSSVISTLFFFSS